uniref:Equilibrative nucleoside transporter 1 n=1 Tax=Macrostomum lignano TaxID=282301 RepID=A0A1I8I166_9PLAT
PEQPLPVNCDEVDDSEQLDSDEAIGNTDNNVDASDNSVTTPLLNGAGSESVHLYYSGCAGGGRGSQDSFNAALFLFFFLGIGSLLPWNFFTTAKGYFNFKLRNVSADSTEDGGDQTAFFWCTMASVMAVNIGAALVQGSLFGLAAMFPHKYVTALMQGQASGGVTAALVYIASLSLGSGALSAGLVYFVSATCVLLLCLLAYLALRRLPFVREQVNRSQSISYDSSLPSAGSSLSLSGQPATWRRALSDLAWPALSVFMVFAVSLSLYPALLSSVSSVARPDSLYFVPLACFLAFNAADLLGRCFVSFSLPSSNRLLAGLALLRLVFVPLFLACNYQPRRQWAIPPAFTSDAALPILVSLFGLSNGYLGALSMTRGAAAAEIQNAELYGALMSFFLTLGLGTGSAASFVFTTLL